uniref:Uncharacterized protein n=1 Tax=Rhizophora mucronata TaxID=61149 RepID=A0A2P2N8I4_RHIMU
MEINICTLSLNEILLHDLKFRDKGS